MKGWATFFRILCTLSIVLSLFAFVFSPVASVGMIISAISCSFFAGLCDRVTEILKNQETILRRMDFLNQ